MSKTFPLYILDIKGKIHVVFPENQKDLRHVKFWEQTVGPLFANSIGVPFSKIKNLPYCQKRARVFPAKKIIYYGETQDKELLREIEKAINIQGLRWVYDEHETRMQFDVFSLNGLLA